MYRLRKWSVLAGLLGCLMAGPSLAQVPCTSTLPDIELRCRNAILIHKAETASVADRLAVCEEGRAEDQENVQTLTQAIVAAPQPPGGDLLLGVVIGTGASAAIAIALAVLLHGP